MKCHKAGFIAFIFCIPRQTKTSSLIQTCDLHTSVLLCTCVINITSLRPKPRPTWPPTSRSLQCSPLRGLQGLDLSVGRPPQKARPLLLLLAMLPMLMGWAARSSVGGRSVVALGPSTCTLREVAFNQELIYVDLGMRFNFFGVQSLQSSTVVFEEFG